MGDEMQTYGDANLHPMWVDVPTGPGTGRRISTAWMLIVVGLLLFWAGAAVALVVLV